MMQYIQMYHNSEGFAIQGHLGFLSSTLLTCNPSVVFSAEILRSEGTPDNFVGIAAPGAAQAHVALPYVRRQVDPCFSKFAGL